MKRIEIIGIGVIFLLFFNFRAFGQQPSIFVDTSTGRITVKATRKQLKEVRLQGREPRYNMVPKALPNWKKEKERS